MTLYEDADEFYQCLKYNGCGYWQIVLSNGNGELALVQIKGQARGTGYLRLAVEGPRWEHILELIETRQQNADKGAF